MNIKEFLAVVDKGWVRKPKGFRVHFQKLTPDGWVTDYLPGKDEKLQESDVVAWRLAWKLFQASRSDDAEFGKGRLVNIYVVDDQDQPVAFYATNRCEIYNPHPRDEQAVDSKGQWTCRGGGAPGSAEDGTGG